MYMLRSIHDHDVSVVACCENGLLLQTCGHSQVTISYACAKPNTQDQSTDGVTCRMIGYMLGIVNSFHEYIVSLYIRVLVQ